jgi:hypothetical protein
LSQAQDIDLENIQIYTKLDIAECQLNQALKLFISQKDYISAITLAGAIEEILGKLLNSRKVENSLQNWVKTYAGFAKIFAIKDLDKKTIISDANYYRDGLKHITDGNPIGVTKEAAIEIIERAIQNFVQLTGNYNSQMIEFHRVLNG